ncbi:hypothetical protein [Roseovarius sp. Pro17]|uniref:hypothetical protein n=1 Tax=Roseovarius sp. Pro17 TaxID=3108175 RepID=UPI002D77402C|nr:hypothetical protein [Roseovarius sp. Pro17]
MTDWFLGLLVVNLRIKRAIGVVPMRSNGQIELRCRQTHRAFFRISSGGVTVRTVGQMLPCLHNLQ